MNANQKYELLYEIFIEIDELKKLVAHDGTIATRVELSSINRNLVHISRFNWLSIDTLVERVADVIDDAIQSLEYLLEDGYANDVHVIHRLCKWYNILTDWCEIPHNFRVLVNND